MIVLREMRRRAPSRSVVVGHAAFARGSRTCSENAFGAASRMPRHDAAIADHM